MFTFIISGYIPGTDYQMSFGLWLNFTLILIAGILALRLARSKGMSSKDVMDKIETEMFMLSVRSMDGWRLLPPRKTDRKTA